MRIDKYTFETVVTADKGKYLKFNDIGENITGKPTRIIFSTQGIVPEFTEEVISKEIKDIDAKPIKKKSKKKSSK